MKIAVTGGSGFIGRHVIERLLIEGNEVTSIDHPKGNPERGGLDHLVVGSGTALAGESNFKCEECDILDAQRLVRLTSGFDAIVHLAALKSMKDSISDAPTYNSVNINGTVNALEAARKNNVKKFVFSSSSAVYGNKNTGIQVESQEPVPGNPYGVTKIAGENYCYAYSALFGLETVSLRLFNVYGSGQGPEGAVPSFIRCAAKSEEAIVYGSEKKSRDFVFVGDVAEAFALSIRHSAMAAGLAVNIGSGTSTSIRELLATVERIVGKKIRVSRKAGFEGDLESTKADISLARKLLSWSPMHSLEQGLAKTVPGSQGNGAGEGSWV